MNGLPKSIFFTTALALLLLKAVNSLSAEPNLLKQPSQSPLINFRIVIHSGAAADPEDKTGLAALTSALISKGGTEKSSYDEIIEALFPMAASVDIQIDKEMTVFHGTTHRENLDAYYDILRSMLLEPGLREDDFQRLKDEAINFLRTTLRSDNEEELAKELLYQKIYVGHPYGNHNVGSVSALKRITLEDITKFYEKHYTNENITIGIAGGYPKNFPEKIKEDFSRLPEGRPEAVILTRPKTASKLRISIVKKDTRGTHIVLGFPINVTRGSPDWSALKLVQSYFGQHRSSKSHLFQRIRGVRGMNYGDYAYIEYFPRGMFRTQPEPNLARRQQIFHIWVRPVEQRNGMFGLRIALYELDKLVREGLSEKDFTSTRQFLSKYVNLLTQTESTYLGYALDSQFYEIGEFNSFLKNELSRLTVGKVNDVIRRHLRANNLNVVVITKDAKGFLRSLRSGKPSSIEYVSPKPQSILAEDKVIGSYPLDLGSIEIIPVNSIFE
ncbi:MAG: hypothetical protein CMN58_02900 [Solibacterales bacterium]|nr:hypothetical protein [Bryobacterales bacterium]|tara:strand:+ start:10140 stop:11636 length:1497 start_codon:yes stop_codon:yes gene_type:complete